MNIDIDHVMIATPDLDATRREFETLGFTVTPRARHVGFGTANHLCVLQGCYVELIGMDPRRDPRAKPYPQLAAALAAGGGVPMMAMASDDAPALAAAWRAAGFDTSDPQTWARDADTPDGRVTARFTTFLLSGDGVPGYLLFGCQQHTRHAIWCAPWMVHPNGTTTLLGVHREWPAGPANLSADYARLVGADRVHATADGTRVDIGTRQLTFSPGHPGTVTVLQLIRRPDAPRRADATPRVTLQSVAGVALEWTDR